MKKRRTNKFSRHTRKIRTHVFNEKRYEIIWRRPDKETDGWCASPSVRAKHILIDPCLKEKDFLETVLHESLHASVFCLAEDIVETSAADISGLLWKLGFRYCPAA